MLITLRVLRAIFGRNRLKPLRKESLLGGLMLLIPSVSARFVTFNHVPSGLETPVKQGVTQHSRCELFPKSRKSRNEQKVTER